MKSNENTSEIKVPQINKVRENGSTRNIHDQIESCLKTINSYIDCLGDKPFHSEQWHSKFKKLVSRIKLAGEDLNRTVTSNIKNFHKE